MLNVSTRELESAYRRHKAASPYSPLLVVYAVECGLKAAILRRRMETSITPEYAHHNIRSFLVELRVSNELMAAMKGVQSKRDGQTIGPAQIHEALRYGVKITDEEALLESLRRIIEWLEGELE